MPDARQSKHPSSTRATLDPESVAALSLLPAPPVALTMLRIAIVKVLLRIIGFSRTCHWLTARTTSAPTDIAPTAESLRRAEYAVALAAALYPGRAECLERSLVLYWYLRDHRVPVRYRMGVQRYPFLAHAWIEWRGQPINDVAEHVRRFQVIDGAEL